MVWYIGCFQPIALATSRPVLVKQYEHLEQTILEIVSIRAGKSPWLREMIPVRRACSQWRCNITRHMGAKSRVQYIVRDGNKVSDTQGGFNVERKWLVPSPSLQPGVS